MRKKTKRKINPARIIFRVFLFILLGFWLVLLVFRWVPVPTSTFILKQNMLASEYPKKYAKARYRWVDYKDMSRYLPLAAIAAEDQKFTEHFGFDLNQINIAISAHSKGERLRGASTITQQLAKNLFLTNARSYVRKALEAFIALSLEILWSKKRILEVYLNIVQFGPVTYGVHQAALENFTKLPGYLNESEAAWLISVLPTPALSRINSPSRNLTKRQNWVLSQMRTLDKMRVLQRL